MNTNQKAKWFSHELEIIEFREGIRWRDEPGIYIFAGISGNAWRAIYIGQSISLKDRLSNHEVWPEAQTLGATHVHAMLARAEDLDTIERDLIQKFRPLLNTQHN